MNLSPADRAQALSNTYQLLGGLFLRGLTPELWGHVEQIEELAAASDVFRRPGPAIEFDEAAADYQHLFGFNVFPYASAFLEPSGSVGGNITDRALDAYREAGFPVATTAESGDHIGVELLFLAFLSSREAAALAADGDDPEVWRERARSFMDENILPWCSSLRVAIHSERHGFFTALVELTAEVLFDHRRGLGESTAPAFELPAPRLDLEAKETTLRKIAGYLLVPGRSGLFLSRDVLREWSKAAALPAGFGARRTMLNNLFSSAVDYDGLSEILEKLLAHVGRARAIHAQATDSPMVEINAVWIARLDESATMIQSIASHYESLVETSEAS